MPPGKGFYGPKYRESGSKDKRLTPLYLLAAVPLLAVFAWVGKCTLGGGSDSPDTGASPDQSQSENQVKPTELPKVAPTRDPAKKAAGPSWPIGLLPWEDGGPRPEGAVHFFGPRCADPGQRRVSFRRPPRKS